jgi:hypothetical protein
MAVLKAGATQIDISPKDSQFLFGYPFIERYSTGIHDKLLSSALYLSQSFVISLANGEMQGYIVTEDAAKEGGYEASNTLFDCDAGSIFVTETLKLLKAM